MQNLFFPVKLLRIKYLFFFFLQIITYVHAQSPVRSDVTPVIEILQKELKEAGVKDELKFGTTQVDNGFFLNLLNKTQVKNFQLENKPEDAFYIKATNKSVQIASTSVAGLRNGAYWYLKRLGFRYYFPNPIWHVKPSIKSVFVPLEQTVSPSYEHRRIWYAYGTGSKVADKDFKKWSEANLLGGVAVNAGHAYEAIVNRNKAVFQQHPEFFAQKVAKGEIPRTAKFEVGNEELVQLVIKDALMQIQDALKKTGELPFMISMDPSDGGGFSTSAASLKIGGPSEQAFYLANRVAKAISKEYPGVRVGLYAYNLHAAPPKFDLEPNIVVLMATALNQTKYRNDELMEMWQKKKVPLGIRDYYGVMAWDWDMPGQPKGGQISYVRNLRKYYDLGIRYFTAETNIGWISRGAGHYIAAQLLWNLETDIDKTGKEFLENMFGKAGSEIEKLFAAWQDYSRPVPLEGDIYKWNQLVDKAGEIEQRKDVEQRLTQVKQYLHYVYLFVKWKENSSDDNLINLLNYAYRIQDEGVAASYPLFRRLANAAVKGKEKMRFNDPTALWKQNGKALNKEEIDQDFDSDLKSLDQLQKTEQIDLPEQFTIKKDGQAKSKNSSLPIRLRGRHLVVFHVQGKNASISLSSGLIKTNEYKTLVFSVFPYNKDLEITNETPLLKETIQPRQAPKQIKLSDLQPGSYIAMIDDAKNGFTMSFSGDVTYGIVANGKYQAWTFGRNNLVIDIKGVEKFTIQNNGAITLRSPKGRIIDLQKERGLITVQLQEGEEGMWQLVNQSGRFTIQGVLPLLSADKDFLIQNDK